MNEEDAGKMLLAAFDALAAEFHVLRLELQQEREAKRELAAFRKVGAERQRRAREREGAGGIAAAIRDGVFDRDGRKCLKCGAADRLSIDHIVPKVKGGDDDISNLQTLCVPCNARKNGGDFRVTSVTQRNVTSQVVKEASKQDQDQDKDKIAASRDVTLVASRIAPAWGAYSAAFEARYGVKPVRNVKVNGQLTHLLKRIPEADIPAVVEFYVGHSLSYYVQKMHPVGLLLQDAEKLCAEWKSGRRVTATSARRQDQTQENVDGWTKHLKGAANGVE